MVGDQEARLPPLAGQLDEEPLCGEDPASGPEGCRGSSIRTPGGLFADFHSLRRTYFSNLTHNGAPLATAQKLARHSTPVHTAARYTRIELTDQHREVEKLPPLKLGPILGRTVIVSSPRSCPNGTTECEPPDGEKPANSSKNIGKTNKNRAERGRFELPVPCGTPVFKTGAIGHSATSPNSEMRRGERVAQAQTVSTLSVI